MIRRVSEWFFGLFYQEKDGHIRNEEIIDNDSEPENNTIVTEEDNVDGK